MCIDKWLTVAEFAKRYNADRDERDQRSIATFQRWAQETFQEEGLAVRKGAFWLIREEALEHNPRPSGPGGIQRDPGPDAQAALDLLYSWMDQEDVPTFAEAARRLDITKEYISQLRTGRKVIPDRLMRALADAGVDVFASEHVV